MWESAFRHREARYEKNEWGLAFETEGKEYVNWASF